MDFVFIKEQWTEKGYRRTVLLRQALMWPSILQLFYYIFIPNSLLIVKHLSVNLTTKERK